MVCILITSFSLTLLVVFRKSVVKMTVKNLYTTCNRLLSSKSSLNRHVKKLHDSDRQRHVRRFHGSTVHQRWLLKRFRGKPDQAINFSLKLWVVAEISDVEIKNILQDAAELMKLNLGTESKKNRKGQPTSFN